MTGDPLADVAINEFGMDPAKVAEARRLAMIDAADPAIPPVVRALALVAVPRLRDARFTFLRPEMAGLGLWGQKHRGQLRLIHTISREEDGDLWSHVSLSRPDQVMPTWEQVRDVFRLIHPDRNGVVVIPPASEHISYKEVAHVWCNLVRPAVPDFSHGLGTI